MPELPEIETVRLQLSKVLPGMTIEAMEVRSPRTVHGDWSVVKGKKVTGIRRKAKVLIMDLEGDVSMAFHFKMTGQLILDKDEKGDTFSDRIVGGHPTSDFTGTLPSLHTRVIFTLSSGVMYFNDQRLFGWVKVGRREEIDAMKFLQELGPEPFDITPEDFMTRVGRYKRPIKLVIMDQTVISGVGNIYANDALWEAEINPRRLANTLNGQQLRALHAGIVKVLNEGIQYGGATAADAKYIDLHGLGGHYQDHFRTYDREGELCLRDDGGIIHRMALGGRGTFFCSKCQE